MSKKPSAPPAVLSTSAAPEEEPIYTFVGAPKINGGYVVTSITVQGNRVIGRQVHNVRAESREYAATVFKTVSVRKVFFPERGAITNLED